MADNSDNQDRNHPKDDDAPSIEAKELCSEDAIIIEQIARKGEKIEAAIKDYLMDEKQREINLKMDEYCEIPTLAFVESYLDEFENSILRLAAGGGPKANKEFVNGLAFEDFYSAGSQISLLRLKQILFSLPAGLVKLSTLKKIKWSDQIPVPKFDDGGNYEGDVGWHGERDFIDGKVHPSRIFIGHTGLEKSAEGKAVSTITLTKIPSTVSNNQRAVFCYQVYVLLHEFMHTIINPIFNDDLEEKVFLNNEKTIIQWMDELREGIVYGREPILTSGYAETFLDDIISPVPNRIIPGMIELICETFAAYMLNIMPNKHEYTAFDLASFGNRELALHSQKKGRLTTDRFRLIKELCDAKFTSVSVTDR
jgi:hypothetical protein